MPYNRNWKNLMAIHNSGVCFYGSSSSDGPSISVGDAIKDLNGNNCNYVKLSMYKYSYGIVLTNYPQSNQSTSEDLRSKVYIGNGTTEFSENDYSLDSQIGSGYFGTMADADCYTTLCKGIYNGISVTSNQAEYTISIIGKNTTANDITISEVGISQVIPTATGASTGAANKTHILVFREVLQTPVTVEPNHTYKIDIKVTL